MHSSTLFTAAGLLALASAAALPQATNTSTCMSADYRAKAMRKHNDARRRHQADLLTWDEELSCAAANDAANLCSNRDGIQGNWYLTTVMDNAAEDPVKAIADATKTWMAEQELFEQFYGVSQPPWEIVAETWHFAQMVWKETTRVGCASARCAGQTLTDEVVEYDAVVCKYEVPADVTGTEWGANVMPKVQWP